MEKAKALPLQHHQFHLLQQIQQQQQQQSFRTFPSNNNINSSILRPPDHQSTQLQMAACEDAWRVCHPDFKQPFSSLEDACQRLIPYHVVADYEAEEDDRILESDTSAQPLSRSQQWDNNISNKVAEFTATFEQQVSAFNDISRKQAIGEFRSEEILMVEQIMLQEERRALYEARAELETRQKEELEAQAASLRMAAIAQAEQLRGESQARAEMMAQGPIRAHEFFDQEQEVNMDAMMNGWGNNMQRSEKEPFEDFLNDEERDNGDMGIQSDWREGREFDLNIS